MRWPPIQFKANAVLKPSLLQPSKQMFSNVLPDGKLLCYIEALCVKLKKNYWSKPCQALSHVPLKDVSPVRIVARGLCCTSSNACKRYASDLLQQWRWGRKRYIDQKHVALARGTKLQEAKKSLLKTLCTPCRSLHPESTSGLRGSVQEAPRQDSGENLKQSLKNATV